MPAIAALNGSKASLTDVSWGASETLDTYVG
jgi:hypothetical protein